MDDVFNENLNKFITIYAENQLVAAFFTRLLLDLSSWYCYFIEVFLKYLSYRTDSSILKKYNLRY